jgi:hypothetical protein
MGSLGAILGQIIAAIFRAIFGTDKSTSYEVRQARPDVPVPTPKTDADYLRELGMEPGLSARKEEPK